MAIFTALATFALAGTALAGTFAVPLLASAFALAAGIGLNYVAQALAGTPQDAATKDNFSTQGRLTAGGDVPRSFGLGIHMTAGSLVYANYWGYSGETPNAYLSQVIAVSDLPREELLEVWVQGERCTLVPAETDAAMGVPLAEYKTGGVNHLWIKFYDGTQTAADTFLTGTVASTDRPYGATRIGTGVCYVIATALVEDKLFSGFPTYKFVMSGIPLYDPTKDSTNGGSGPMRYSDPSTWGGDGSQLPAVQIYNVLRGIHYGSTWLYGLQNMAGAARLPAANWNAQIAKCRTSVDGEDGLEPAYRSGGQINCNSQAANAIEALLTACQGRLSEIGGFYKIHLGAPDSPVFSWTDADLLSSEQQTYRPFFSLADSVNGIQGTYPSPEEAWETATAPALYRSDLEARDGNRRLMAAPQFDFVPYPAQVQRLQKSGLEEAQRARTHVLPMPPAYWVVEPGDVGSWSSFRNGYEDKLFRVDSVSDQPNLDCVFNVTEIDPADYDWDHATDYTGVTIGPTVIPRPQPQGVVDWYAEGTVLYDADGLGRRPAIRIAWDGSLPGVVGVQYEVRLTADLSHVTRGRTDQLAAGALIISQGLIPETAYQVRGQYLPSSPREMLWSDWLDVTTPMVSEADIPAWISVQVTEVMDYLNDRLAEVEQRFATLQSTDAARNWTDQKEIRSQLSSRSDAAFAEISHVETVATSADAALASSIDTLEATVGDHTAMIEISATAIASIEGWGAAQYSVTLNVDGYATGFELVNGGPGVSSTTFITDKFQIAAPGVSGGDPVGIFTVANVDGVPKIGIRSDMYVDGSIYGSRIVAGSITATEIEADSITADRLVTGTITSDSGKIGNLGVKTLSIAGNAVTVPVAQGYSTTITSAGGTMASFTMAVDTAGMAGESIGIWAIGTLFISGFGTTNALTMNLIMDGATVQTLGGVSYPNPLGVVSWRITITGTGGTVNVPISITASVGVSSFTASGTLFAIATKR